MSEDLINTEAEACSYTIWNVHQLYFSQLVELVVPFMFYGGADKSLARPGRKQAWKHVRDARDFNSIET